MGKSQDLISGDDERRVGQNYGGQRGRADRAGGRTVGSSPGLGWNSGVTGACSSNAAESRSGRSDFPAIHRIPSSPMASCALFDRRPDEDGVTLQSRRKGEVAVHPQR